MISVNENVVMIKGDAATISAEFSVICGAICSELRKASSAGSDAKVKKTVRELCSIGLNEWTNFELNVHRPEKKRKYERKSSSGVVFNA